MKELFSSVPWLVILISFSHFFLWSRKNRFLFQMLGRKRKGRLFHYELAPTKTIQYFHRIFTSSHNFRTIIEEFTHSVTQIFSYNIFLFSATYIFIENIGRSYLLRFSRKMQQHSWCYFIREKNDCTEKNKIFVTYSNYLIMSKRVFEYNILIVSVNILKHQN